MWRAACCCLIIKRDLFGIECLRGFGHPFQWVILGDGRRHRELEAGTNQAGQDLPFSTPIPCSLPVEIARHWFLVQDARGGGKGRLPESEGPSVCAYPKPRTDKRRFTKSRTIPGSPGTKKAMTTTIARASTTSRFMSDYFCFATICCLIFSYEASGITFLSTSSSFRL